MMKYRIFQTIKKLAILIGLYHSIRIIQRQFIVNQKVKWLGLTNFYSTILPDEKLNYILCFDIGANIGERTEALLALGCRVISIEPNDDLSDELKARCKHYRSWNLCQIAVGSEPSLKELFIREYIGQASLLKNWGDGSIKTIKHVPVLPLSILIGHFGIPYYIKIDVEGYENDVLDTLEFPLNLISFEFHLTESNINATKKCLNKIMSLGSYEINLCDAGEPRFSSSRWISIEDFVDIFPSQVQAKYSMQHSYADLYCRLISGA